ncbi:putative membrane-bound metal-dependent hydrolase [Halarchaeum acidiphilum MH1-52-1]|uniref:Putative membrane-bound metal-dependent hydrolase n=1 Tax=Halarchaeum acidiphilum MH1-52-1 TaxID=1261545 RepID=U2YVI7_9EURY|nr:metal-dependent hydrolase [Halarchaeum acidiphilum]GAD53040.1 putative membrane-bound metal-dependent hydrolase [Halarchaeum acidiphilum MH1-52-1]
MYRTGHYGVSLIVYAPVLAACLLLGARELALVGGVGMLALAPVPDYDQRVPGVRHRGVTHTLAFAAFTGLALGVIGALLPADAIALPIRVAFAAGIGVLGIVGHLAGDVLTPAGVRPLWPVSSREYTLSLWTAANPVANYGLLAAGIGVTAAVLLALA